MFDSLIHFIRAQYGSDGFIPLHAPVFPGNDGLYVADTIQSTFVSSVGGYVDRFEREVAAYTGSPSAVATTNGTAALHVALLLAGVKAGDIVMAPALTFVATCNAIRYCGAEPAFVDVDRATLGLSPTALEAWLSEHAHIDREGVCRARSDGKRIQACLPMHTFGHPADLDGLSGVCARWSLVLVEDAAESLGSLYKGRHTGTVGAFGTLSFNGNKIITTGGGGMILTSEAMGSRAKHLTTTAKRPHPVEFFHDELGYNYRLPNINAALGCAQFEWLERFVESKRLLARRYAEYFRAGSIRFFEEPEGCRSNYWLNAVICEDQNQRDALLKATNERQVMTRPIWTLMSKLPMYLECRRGSLSNSEWFESRVVNLPSSVLPESLK